MSNIFMIFKYLVNRSYICSTESKQNKLETPTMPINVNVELRSHVRKSSHWIT